LFICEHEEWACECDRDAGERVARELEAASRAQAERARDALDAVKIVLALAKGVDAADLVAREVERCETAVTMQAHCKRDGALGPDAVPRHAQRSECRVRAQPLRDSSGALSPNLVVAQVQREQRDVGDEQLRDHDGRSDAKRVFRQVDVALGRVVHAVHRGIDRRVDGGVCSESAARNLQRVGRREQLGRLALHHGQPQRLRLGLAARAASKLPDGQHLPVKVDRGATRRVRQQRCEHARLGRS